MKSVMIASSTTRSVTSNSRMSSTSCSVEMLSLSAYFFCSAVTASWRSAAAFMRLLKSESFIGQGAFLNARRGHRLEREPDQVDVHEDEFFGLIPWSAVQRRRVEPNVAVGQTVPSPPERTVRASFCRQEI